MRLKNFRVQNYRSILDSSVVKVEPLTVLLGKNESGKTSLLKALYKLNPANSEVYDVDTEWPRSHRSVLDESYFVCEAEFEITPKERDDINYYLDAEIATDRITVMRSYTGQYTIKYDDTINPLISVDKKIAKFDGIITPHLEFLTETELAIIYKLKDMAKFSLPMFKMKKGQLLRNAGIAEPVVLGEKVSEAFEATHSSLSGFIDWWEGEIKKQEDAKDYIVSEMPKFIYIDEYSVFRGRANLKEVAARKAANGLTAVDNTILTIMSLAGLSLDTEVKKIDNPNVAQRQFDLEDAGKELSESLANRWQQRDFKIEFRVDGNEFLTFIRDDVDGSLIDLEERSKGFQWFLSFDLTFMRETRGEFKNAVLLLDEPGLYLHPDAQQDMLRRLEEYSELNTIIYTTHLPFMIELSHPERIRVMNESREGSYVTEDLTGGDVQSKLVLQSALGMSGASSYLLADRNLVVEGVHDYWIITALSNYLKRIGKEGLRNDVFITPAGGATHAVNLATFMIGQKLKTIVLLDSDAEGNKARDSLVKNWLIKFSEKSADVIQIGQILNTEKIVEIEDILPEKYYYDTAKERYRDDFAEKGIRRPALHRSNSSIADDVANLFRSKGLRFNKGSVAMLLRDKINASSSDDDLELVQSAENLINYLKSAFDALADVD